MGDSGEYTLYTERSDVLVSLRSSVAIDDLMGDRAVVEFQIPASPVFFVRFRRSGFL